MPVKIFKGSQVSVPNPLPVSGPLTDTQLRATPVPVSGPLTDTELRASAVPVSGPLTDTELRATAVPVSGPLTDTQLRASAVPFVQSVPAALTVKNANITVGTTAVRLTTDGLAVSATRQKLLYMADPNSTASFYVGNSSVATSGANQGVPLFPGQLIEELFDANDYYIISDTVGQSVLVLEVE